MLLIHKQILQILKIFKYLESQIFPATWNIHQHKSELMESQCGTNFCRRENST